MKKTILLLLSLLLLNGCAGMSFFPEYRLGKGSEESLAHQNAFINAALVKGYLTHDEVSELLYYMHQLINISSRFDKKLFTKTYNETFNQGMQEDQQAELKAASHWFIVSGRCRESAKEYADEYHRAARLLAHARQQDAMHLAMFTQNMNAMANSVDPMKYSNISIPGVNFAPQTPPMVLPKNLLVNTSGGLRQCRVTTSGVVFCF